MGDFFLENSSSSRKSLHATSALTLAQVNLKYHIRLA